MEHAIKTAILEKMYEMYGRDNVKIFADQIIVRDEQTQNVCIIKVV